MENHIFSPIFFYFTSQLVQVDDDVFVNSLKVMEIVESSHLYFKTVTYKGLDGSPVSKGLDYVLLGSVQNSVPIRDPTRNGNF